MGSAPPDRTQRALGCFPLPKGAQGASACSLLSELESGMGFTPDKEEGRIHGGLDVNCVHLAPEGLSHV